MKPISFRSITSVFGSIGIYLALGIALSATDWPKWLGPNENNQVAAADNFDPNLDNWKIAWQKNVGLGYSSVTTFQGKVYTMGHDGRSKETIAAFDHTTGEELWSYTYEGDLIPSMHVGGPNASVLISDGHAYAVSKDGQVICLDANTGKQVWNAYLTELLGIDVPKWGFGSSPVAFRNEIIVSAGKVIAFDKQSGSVNWISPDTRKPGYGTPIIFDRNRENFIAATDAGGLSILRISNGVEVARKDMRVKFDVFLTSPAIFEGGNKILLFNNSFSELYSFDGKALSVDWSDRKLQNTLHGSVRLGDSIYGMNGGHKNKKTSLFSRNFSDGSEQWVVPNYGYASMIAVGDTLVILTEDGELVTAPANSDSYQEISRKKLLDGICWTTPTYAEEKIYIRNEHGVLIVLDKI